MSADEREAVEMGLDRAHCDSPAVDRVTVLAFRAELAAVQVRMAIRALLADVSEDFLHVALGASNRRVGPAQRKARFTAVVEFRSRTRRLPARRGMTVLAGQFQGTVRIACASLSRSLGVQEPAAKRDHRGNNECRG